MPIPQKLRDEMADDPYYKYCARASGHCEGRITWEHAMTYAGKRINEKWAIIPLCEFHHGLLGSGGMNKSVNVSIALARANREDLEKYPRAFWAKP